MVTDEKDGIFLNFFAYETIGGIVVNRAGVCKVTYDAKNINECTFWTDPVDASDSAGA